MVFEVQGMTDSFVRLERDNSGIEFLGKSFYRIGSKVKAQVYHYIRPGPDPCSKCKGIFSLRVRKRRSRFSCIIEIF